MAFIHQTVLRDEAVAALQPRSGKVIVDGTLGGGGHSEALLGQGARVIGIDRDPAALAAARARLSGYGAQFEARAGNFGDVEGLLGGEVVDGLLLDLGVSSPQLDTAERGFSFQADGPLDMRMAQAGETAAELVERLDEPALADLLFRLGDEPFGRAIARELKRALPRTTAQAAEAVARAVPRAKWPRRIHVATRTFQALRMAVNGELEALASALEALPRVLKPGGRAAIISFHSLEDRMVKERFRALEGRCTCPPGLPVCGCGQRGSFRALERKAVTATELELEHNPRARSAHLRAVERLP